MSLNKNEEDETVEILFNDIRFSLGAHDGRLSQRSSQERSVLFQSPSVLDFNRAIKCKTINEAQMRPKLSKFYAIHQFKALFR
jgi:hypothetical protein